MPIVTVNSLQSACLAKMLDAGVPESRAKGLAYLLGSNCYAYGISQDPELSMFLAQVAHESGGFSRTVENLNYSAGALRRLWGHRFTKEQANQYGRTAQHPANQEVIASIAYGGRMGNGTWPGSNDGWRYRGRGFIQLTGRNNYRRMAKWLEKPDLLLEPDKVALPVWAVTTACAYWVNTPGIVEAARGGDVKLVTRIINGGYNGLDHREKLYLIMMSA